MVFSADSKDNTTVKRGLFFVTVQLRRNMDVLDVIARSGSSNILKQNSVLRHQDKLTTGYIYLVESIRHNKRETGNR